MLYLYDKLGKRIGCIKAGRVSFCFDNLGRYIGRVAQSGYYLFLYKANGSLMGIFNGRHTLDGHNNYIGSGNLLYYLLYPTLETIR